jgi:hypothetical protein
MTISSIIIVAEHILPPTRPPHTLITITSLPTHMRTHEHYIRMQANISSMCIRTNRTPFISTSTHRISNTTLHNGFEKYKGIIITFD